MNTKFNFVPAVVLAAGVLVSPAYAKAAAIGSSALPTEGQSSVVYKDSKADKKADKADFKIFKKDKD